MPKNFTDVFHEARLRARVTYRKLGAACGLKIGELCDIEKGRRHPPPSEILEKIKPALGITDGALIAAAKNEFDFQNGKAVNRHEYALYVTRRQLDLIKTFADVCSFLLMGKIEHPLWNLFISREIDYHEFQDRAFALKQVIFPELARNAWYGVGWKDGDSRQNQSQIGYEIQGMIAHELWKREDQTGFGGVRDAPPLHYSTESLIRVETVKNAPSSTDELLAEAGMRILKNARRHLLHSQWIETIESIEFVRLTMAINRLDELLAKEFSESGE